MHMWFHAQLAQKILNGIQPRSFNNRSGGASSDRRRRWNLRPGNLSGSCSGTIRTAIDDMGSISGTFLKKKKRKINMISIENCRESGYEGLDFYEKYVNCRCLHDNYLKKIVSSISWIKSSYFDQTYFQKFYLEIYN